MYPTDPPIAGDPTDQPLDRYEVRRALHGVAVRAQAVGVLMSQFSISADDAAHRLAGHARDAGVPVEILANELMAPYIAVDDGPTGIAQTG